jgi:hypothetical protein
MAGPHYNFFFIERVKTTSTLLNIATMKMTRQKGFTTLITIIGIFIALFSLLLSSCDDKVEVTQKYTVMAPVYITPETLRASFDVLPPVEVSNTGKIYLYENYILLNEPGKGIHIIDNQDRENPQIISFINIPGNYEIAVRGNRLFADSYVDLLVIDITDPLNVKLIKRIEDIFMELALEMQNYDPENGIIVDYEPQEIIEVTQGEFQGTFPSYYYYGTGLAFRGAFNSMDMALSSFAPESAPVVSTGIGGSMARFTISKEHLYSISTSTMQVFDITDLDNPIPGANMNVRWGIETIFPYKENLFIGSQSGMIIYDITNPDEPEMLSEFNHIVSCDPVVVENDIAYVTLRGGSGCRNGFTNQLDVIDVSDLTSPKLLATHLMTNPHGLGIDNGVLFICEGSAGLKVFDASDVYKIPENMLAYFGEFDAFDVIPYNNNLILIGQDGLYQFDYSDTDNIRMLSKISINREEAAK